MVKSKYKEKGNNLINVVYIGGFLVPRGRMPYSDDFHLPKSTRVILVYPSGVSSMHDRVMQIFYELKGGTVHYGEEHSKFHKHAPTGVTFNRPKLPEWNEDNPVHVIGHSYGGITARALYYYLSQGNMFHGHVTNSSWIVSVTAVNSPLNGCLRVYSYGANLISPSIVRLYLIRILFIYMNIILAYFMLVDGHL
jgi:triacylglycerol esterase/lipase EstA (alpha/beta hydrolase family)